MGEPFLGEMKMWGLKFAPKNWAFCDGQDIPINEHTALYTLLGTNYGGNGTTTFGIPDMRGRVPIHKGSDDMGSFYREGWDGGEESVVLTPPDIQSHTHEMQATQSIADENTIGKDSKNVFAESSGSPGYRPATNLVTLSSGTVSVVGGGRSHNNMQPSLAITFTIALQGTYPNRN